MPPVIVLRTPSANVTSPLKIDSPAFAPASASASIELVIPSASPMVNAPSRSNTTPEELIVVSASETEPASVNIT